MCDSPSVGITMGDPAGIGPEIIAKALDDETIYEICRPVVLGDPAVLFAAIQKFSPQISLNILSGLSEFLGAPGKVDLMPMSKLNEGDVLPGKPTLAGGRAMIQCILKAVEMTRRKELEALVTCPISKILMHQAGYSYDGHTELISGLLNTKNYVMMLAGKALRVALVTIHCALKDVPAVLNSEMIHKTITITAKALQEDFGFESPRLAVAALNPHAGESGLFGSEEVEMIGPAVNRAKDEGYEVVGPLPADTLFHSAVSGQFEAVIAMYHDQGLIPLKLMHFSDAVNVTLGLPIIRTSVDHGTAYDIAGTGQADASSLKAAIKMTAKMVKNREKHRKEKKAARNEYVNRSYKDKRSETA
jgi:4-hydroxythreonine-4-phosphate dehydrogenase